MAITITDIIALAGLAAGTLGTVLSVLNFVYFVSDRHVKVEVVLKLSYLTPTGVFNMRYPFYDSSERIAEVRKNGLPLFPGVEIINHGKATVIVDEVGFLLRKSIRSGRLYMKEDLVLPETNRPFRLPPSESITLYSKQSNIYNLDKEIKWVYLLDSRNRLFTTRLHDFSNVIQWLNTT